MGVTVEVAVAFTGGRRRVEQFNTTMGVTVTRGAEVAAWLVVAPQSGVGSLWLSRRAPERR